MSGVSRIHLDYFYNTLQAFQCTRNDRAMSPRADVIDIKDVSASLRRETLGRNSATECRRHSTADIILSCRSVSILSKVSIVRLEYPKGKATKLLSEWPTFDAIIAEVTK